jgi:L-aminopeptidase/D-esterase-like protein
LAETPVSNDNTLLIPRTAFDGPALRFDFPALQIGIAEYEEGPTGCTVFYFPKGAACAMDIRGGSPGYIGDYGWTNAICLAGGSLYGLEAAAGVAAEFLAMRGYSTQWFEIGLVSGAIIFDYGPRNNAIYPDKALGRAALKAAQAGVFPLGPRGAGRSATAGKAYDFSQAEPAGQGGAFRQIGPTNIAVFTVVNALGAIVDRQGNVVRGNLDRNTHRRCPMVEYLEQRAEQSKPPKGNTTLTVLVTNQKLGTQELRQFGRQVHSSMGRAIQPFHAIDDGDVLFAVTTSEVENESLGVTALGVYASELAWDAVLSSFLD